MIFPLVATGVLLVPTLVLALLRAGYLLLRRRPLAAFWRRVIAWHLLLVPVHLFVTFPLLLGWVGTHVLGTRPDERAWQGPRLDAAGHWQLQTRDSLRAEAQAAPPPAVVAAQQALAVAIPGADGVTLRAFRVPAPAAPRAVALLVHGLFRSGMELETPAALLRELGCECWLLEQRNHGGSSRGPATFGWRESRDVLAAVAYVRAQPERARLPLLLYGISLGTVSVALALPELDAVAGVVLDAPVDDLLATAHRMLDLRRDGDRRARFALDEPWRSLVLLSVELWSGFRFADVQPARTLQGLPAHLPVLLIGGEHDDKIPAANVRALFDSLPMPTGTKALWIVPGAGHGDGFVHAPADYRRQLGAFVQPLLR